MGGSRWHGVAGKLSRPLVASLSRFGCKGVWGKAVHTGQVVLVNATFEDVWISQGMCVAWGCCPKKVEVAVPDGAVADEAEAPAPAGAEAEVSVNSHGGGPSANLA